MLESGSATMAIELDLNNPAFQDKIFALKKPEIIALMKTVQKIAQLEWMPLYRDRKLNWQVTAVQTDVDRERICTLRITPKCRATVQRRGNRIVFLELHSDHNSAY
jgi:hypothetical protein